MKLVKIEQENHLSKINRLLSEYRVLEMEQMKRLFPELSEELFQMLLKRLEKSGRLVLDTEHKRVKQSADCKVDAGIIAAFWVLLDFYSEVLYQTVSEFPVTLTFYTETEGYDVVYIPEEKEMIMNHALSAYEEQSLSRLVIVDKTEQIAKIEFPGIAAFCVVHPEGDVQYYKKQGEKES